MNKQAPINLYAAKTQLSSLVERAAAGEEIIIAKNGKPMAKLVPIPADKPKRAIPWGDLAHLFTPEERQAMCDAALEPTPEEEIDHWYNSTLFPDQDEGLAKGSDLIGASDKTGR